MDISLTVDHKEAKFSRTTHARTLSRMQVDLLSRWLAIPADGLPQWQQENMCLSILFCNLYSFANSLHDLFILNFGVWG